LGDWAGQQETLIPTLFTLGQEGLLPSIAATVVRQTWKRKGGQVTHRGRQRQAVAGAIKRSEKRRNGLCYE
jgi:hypothetical protein